MAMDGRWLMSGKKTTILLLAAMLAGCASEAPPLPPDTTGTTSAHRLTERDFTAQDRGMTCFQIADQRSALRKGIDKANANIASNRDTNQVATYFGGWLLPLALTDGNYSDKDIIKAAYVRLDTLNQLSVLRSCPN